MARPVARLRRRTALEALARLRLPDGGLPRRVAVLRALQLGDLLCSVPALRALRRAVPDARITLIGLPSARSFFARFPHLLDELLVLPGYPGLPEQEPQPEAIPGFLAEVQARRFDAVLQMHGSGLSSNPLAALLGGRVVAGFVLPGRYCPDPERFLPYPAHEPEVRRHLRLMEFLGVPPAGEELEFPICLEDVRELEKLGEAGVLRWGEYACLHPGARSPARRWPARGFAEVGDALAASGLQVVLTGTAEEADVTREVAGRMTSPVADLAGRTAIGALAVLLSRARILVCNDTGVSHMAAALRVPSVVVFTESDPGRWAPLDRDLHRVVRGPDAEANPCRHTEHPSRHRCLRDACSMWARSTEEIDRQSIPSSAVLVEVEALLSREPLLR